MSRRPPHRAAIAALVAGTILVSGLPRPAPVSVTTPSVGTLTATWQPSFLSARLTLEMWK
ncbi:hypothetical protein D9601_14675 [Sphingomonas sp. MA1305]|uniref:hypothetical protein n=1 Tax=Sphingomonas sp. MA1305 TaxID=2479204 RepID=UPI0018E0519D|nr:hypothetical protein [Sphingomonas sp. MA1305]MBI0476592.1 hypothetical protein [Sphingomonas sp. MA1305]